MTHHVVLVGLSGTGKTSVGRRVAVRLDRPFVDADEKIESRAGRSVREVFESDGEDAFRELEADVMADLLASPVASVIATGGGAVIAEATRKLLREPDVFVVWLTAAPAFLASRLSQKPHRPLLDDDPVASLTRLAEQRDGWYADVANVTIDVQPAHMVAPKPEAKDNLAATIAAMVPA
jgi:shikimate kinase